MESCIKKYEELVEMICEEKGKGEARDEKTV